MEIVKGTVVKSVAGHDKGSFYTVVDVSDGVVYIADGKRRKLEKPKRKNPKHVKVTKTILELDGMTNKRLRSSLSVFNPCQPKPF